MRAARTSGWETVTEVRRQALIPADGGRRVALAARRRALGLTQAAVAARVGVNPRAVAEWEAGDAVPRGAFHPALASVLDVDQAGLYRLLSGLPWEGGAVSGDPVGPVPRPAPASSVPVERRSTDARGAVVHLGGASLSLEELGRGLIALGTLMMANHGLGGGAS